MQSAPCSSRTEALGLAPPREVPGAKKLGKPSRILWVLLLVEMLFKLKAGRLEFTKRRDRRSREPRVTINKGALRRYAKA